MCVDKLLEEIIKNEGGFVNDPIDRGGATNMGITQKTLENFLGRAVTEEEVKNLKIETAKEIYKKNYYIQPNIHLLPPPIDGVIFDICVMSGAHRAGLILQTSLSLLNYRVAIDGKIGAKTISVTKQVLEDNKLKDLLREVAFQRIRFYRAIVERDKSQARFIKGWEARANKYINIQENHFV